MNVATNTAWRVAVWRRLRVTIQLYCGLV